MNNLDGLYDKLSTSVTSVTLFLCLYETHFEDLQGPIQAHLFKKRDDLINIANLHGASIMSLTLFSVCTKHILKV